MPNPDKSHQKLRKRSGPYSTENDLGGSLSSSLGLYGNRRGSFSFLKTRGECVLSILTAVDRERRSQISVGTIASQSKNVKFRVDVE